MPKVSDKRHIYHKAYRQSDRTLAACHVEREPTGAGPSTAASPLSESYVGRSESDIPSDASPVSSDSTSLPEESDEELQPTLVHVSRTEPNTLSDIAHSVNVLSVGSIDRDLVTTSEVSTDLSILDRIRVWAVNHNVTHAAVTALLKVLRTHPAHADFPSDARTLLGTPRNTGAKISPLCNGKYCHFGVAAGLQSLFNISDCLPSVLQLIISIDGLPISKSSKLQLWPIQCTVKHSCKSAVFLVGVYAGTEKPASANEFLSPLVSDLKQLCSDGITINDQTSRVVIESFVCDSPARAFVLSTKGHNARSGCPKCTV
ncbi:uncharacterized protein LOC135386901 isoform X1 [Ornithodoros turicata]|uniref:uncharacterized protein LOC135386901 isoform X1 n=1 Tax=Ornithodoros turicata TaxID=34597 RepID=UPI0031397E40